MIADFLRIRLNQMIDLRQLMAVLANPHALARNRRVACSLLCPPSCAHRDL
jgi:hypothetical protein